MNKIKPLTLEETELKEEMKLNCLKREQYVDEKAEDKFKMLCHLEDFEIQYFDLQERIDRAVEYIKHYESIRGYYEYVECGYDEYNYEEDLKEDLLEILKGEKE